MCQGYAASGGFGSGAGAYPTPDVFDKNGRRLNPDGTPQTARKDKDR
jgi:hypothetical protein